MNTPVTQEYCHSLDAARSLGNSDFQEVSERLIIVTIDAGPTSVQRTSSQHTRTILSCLQ